MKNVKREDVRTVTEEESNNILVYRKQNMQLSFAITPKLEMSLKMSDKRM